MQSKPLKHSVETESGKETFAKDDEERKKIAWTKEYKRRKRPLVLARRNETHEEQKNWNEETKKKKKTQHITHCPLSKENKWNESQHNNLEFHHEENS